MNINKKDVRRVNRILQKYKVSFEFVLLNFAKVIQLYKYVTSSHLVIKRKLVKKRNKVVIKYYTLRKSLFSSENKKKRRNKLPWSTRVVQYIKRQKVVEKIQDDYENTLGGQSDSLSPEEIQKKLKEQLELLKSGKKTVPLISGNDKHDDIIKTASITARDLSTVKETHFIDSVIENQRVNGDSDELKNLINSEHMKGNSERLLVLPDYGEESNESHEIYSQDEDPLDTSVKGPFKENLKFLDLLINKMQIVGGKRKGEHAANTVQQNVNHYSSKAEQILQKSLAVIESKNQPKTIDSIDGLDYSKSLIDVQTMDCPQIEIADISPTIVKDSENPTAATTPCEEASSSSSEFLGFTEYELVPSTVPGMLPTPIVANSKKDSHQSAFVSEDLENFLRDNALESVTRVEVPKRNKTYEDGLMCDGATPPRMIMPVIPADLTKPRTVAEKRYILQRKQSIKYYMIENENTIYRELKKRTKYGKANTSVVRCIQNLEVPCTRDCWKASAWLCTENGRFYFQILKVDGVIVKLVGGPGNHVSKYMQPQLSRPPRKLLPKTCSSGCRQNVDFRNVTINMSDDEFEVEKVAKDISAPDLRFQIGQLDEKISMKPGPLSSKCMFAPFQPNMGELEIYEMPKIQLEVFPEVDKPLDEAVKPYLKYILPANCITKEWAEFAASTVVAKTEMTEKEHPKSFTFTIPYLNNQNNILVRKMYNRKEKLEKLSTKDFDFRKDVDTDDEIAVECADILSEMINSVAIGLSEDSLIKDDPDIDYSVNTKVNEETVRRDSGEEKVPEISDKKPPRTRKNKLVSELRKLNATVIDAESLCSLETKVCKVPHCRYGCICQSLSGQPIQRKYCKKSECMLQCSCKHIVSTDIDDLVNTSLTTESALLIRRKATEKLAKVEKDFCATVVLTDKETYVINEPTKERKRSKRVPKRFDDYETTEGKEKRGDDEDPDSLASIPKLYPFDDEPPPKRFKHCTVDLYKLAGLENIEPWCMVHCLYKCFCKGENVTGVPFEIKKEETVVTEEIAYPRRKIYSFDKETNETTLPSSEQNLMKRKNPSTVDRYESPSKLQRLEEDRMESICRRIMPVPARMYLKENRRKAAQVRKNIRVSENGSTRLILVEKVQRSLHFRLPNYKGCEQSPNNRSLLKVSQNNKTTTIDSNEHNMEVESISDVESNKTVSKLPVIASVCSLSDVPELNSKLNSHSSNNTNESSPNPSLPGDIRQYLQSTEKNAGNSEDSSTVSGASTFIQEIPAGTSGVHSQIHNQAIRKLNLAVTQSMHSICTIQKSNTKKIPDPVPNTLSCHQWHLFLQAYVEGTVHIWEVRINNGSFLAATLKNLMPIVPNAHSVVNIKAISKHKLPLIGKMLNAKFINDKTRTLSVLLTGHRNYWRIIGYINSSYDYLTKGGVFKPTPQTHPWLSKKINLLYNMVILRQIHGSNRIMVKERNAPTTSQPPPASETEIETSSEDNTGSNVTSTETSLGNISKNVTIAEAYSSTFKSITSPVPSIAISAKYAQESSSEENTEGHTFQMDQEAVGIPVTQVPKCNLEIKRVSYRDIEGIVIPVAIPGDHRWLVLDIVGDFSHIYIPAWRNFLSYDKIKKALILTERTKKIVRIGQDKSKIDVFAAPDIRERIYLGPYAIEAEQNIVLYQNIDGRMMLREDFEISHKISRERRTTGFWLYKKFGKLIFDIDLRSLHISSFPALKNSLDDDCVIVDDKIDSHQESEQSTSEKHENNESKNVMKEVDTGVPPQKTIVSQQSNKREEPLQIDLDSDASAHESAGEADNKPDNRATKTYGFLKSLSVSTMQVAKISTKLGMSNIKIVKTGEASPISGKNTSKDKLEAETNAVENATLKVQPDIAKGKDPVMPKPNNLKICDVSISLSEHSPDTICYGPPTTSQDNNKQSANPKGRSSLTCPMSSLLINALKSTESKSTVPATVTTKTGPLLRPPQTVPTRTYQKILPKSESLARSQLTSMLPSSSPTPVTTTSNSPPNCLPRKSYFSTAMITSAENPTQLVVKKSGSSNNVLTSLANDKKSSSTSQSSPKTIFLRTAQKTTIENKLNSETTAVESTTKPIIQNKLVVSSNSDKVKSLAQNGDPVCGYIECEDKSLGKFPAKKVGDVYFLKMPLMKGVYRVKGMDMVNKYMNGYIKKNLNYFKNMSWKFLAYKVYKRVRAAIHKDDQTMLNGSSLNPGETTITSTKQVDGEPRKILLTMTRNASVVQKKPLLLEQSMVETESKLTKLKDFTVKKTFVSKDAKPNPALTKDKWKKVIQASINSPSETASLIKPNSLLRKVLSQPAKLPPVPPPEKTSTLLVSPTVKTPPPRTVPASKTPSPITVSADKTPSPVTKPAAKILSPIIPLASKTPLIKPSPLLPISVRRESATEEVILIEDDE